MQIDVQSLISVVRLGCGANYLLSSLWQLARDQRSNQVQVHDIVWLELFPILPKRPSFSSHSDRYFFLSGYGGLLRAGPCEKVAAWPKSPR